MFWEILARLAVAMALGGAIGLEREYRAKEAGFRTHFLVALGSALFTVISVYAFTGGRADISRVAAQVVSGIGFLGAGTIIFQRNFIRGLTTAAGLWVTAAVGMACGTGYFRIAAAATVLVLVGLEVMDRFVVPVGTSHMLITFRSGDAATARNVAEQVRMESKTVHDYSFKEEKDDGKLYYNVSMEVKLKGKNPAGRLMELLKDFDNVTISRME